MKSICYIESSLFTYWIIIVYRKRA